MEPTQVTDDSKPFTLDDRYAYPEALVAAIGSDGLFVTMPESLGVAPHQVVDARSALDIVVPEDRIVVIEAWDLVKATGLASAGVHLAHPSGQPVRMHFIDAREQHGVYLAVLVPDGEAARADLRLGSVPLAVPRFARTRKNDTAVVVDVDDAAVRMLGWSAEQMVGKRSLDFIHPDDHHAAIECWMQMLAAPGKTLRVRLRHLCSDATWKWVEISNTNCLDDPEAGYVLADLLDISDEMAATDALRSREQLLFRLAEALPSGVLQVDLDRNVVYANTRMGPILGVSAGATTHERFTAVIEIDQERLEAALAGALDAGTDSDLEVGIRNATGSQRRCQIAVRALSAEDGTSTGAIVCATDVTESARLRAELERQATTDMLTGCRNRNSVVAELTELVQSCDDLAVIFVDINDFKSVNDRLGHAAGDEVLVTLAGRLRGAVRATDIVGRVGGDEFLVVCPDAGGILGARNMMRRVADAVHRPAPARSGVELPGASVGVAHRLGRDLTADQLVAEADASMYSDKRSPRVNRKPRLSVL